MSTNAEQFTYWNEVGGPKWVRYQAMLDRQMIAVGAATMDAARLEAGDAVLDVGCGCGSTTLAIARRLGASGRCTGIDISRPMLALARERARAAGLDNVTFVHEDAQTCELRPQFDVLFSRFGLMFFDDPVRAFSNLHRAMRGGARLAFVCWQPLHRNQPRQFPLHCFADSVAVPRCKPVQHQLLDVQ